MELARVALQKRPRVAQEPALDRALVPRPPDVQTRESQRVRGRLLRQLRQEPLRRLKKNKTRGSFR